MSQNNTPWAQRMLVESDRQGEKEQVADPLTSTESLTAATKKCRSKGTFGTSQVEGPKVMLTASRPLAVRLCLAHGQALPSCRPLRLRRLSRAACLPRGAHDIALPGSPRPRGGEGSAYPWTVHRPSGPLDQTPIRRRAGMPR